MTKTRVNCPLLIAIVSGVLLTLLLVVGLLYFGDDILHLWVVHGRLVRW